MPLIRKAGARDARALAQLAERTFRETFAAENRAEDLELHCRSSYGEALQARELAAPDLTTFVAEDASTLVGFAQVRRGRAPGCVRAEAPGEVQRLYVSGEWHGRGVAQRLMHACLEELAARGADVAWLGVWERN
ncbi:MAG: GNAT family N-acetyltransferase, partial [Myxococcales bacterium]